MKLKHSTAISDTAETHSYTENTEAVRDINIVNKGNSHRHMTLHSSTSYNQLSNSFEK